MALAPKESFTIDGYPEGLEDGYGLCEYGDHGSYWLPVLYSLFFVLGILGNAFVLWVKIFGERIRTMTDVCLLNLAFADLLLVCSLPFLAHQAWDQWLFGKAMCKVVLCVYLMGFYCGIFFIIVMSVDWYLAIVHVFSSNETRTSSVGKIIAAVIWVAGLIASFPELIFVQVHTISDRTVCGPSYTSEKVPRHFWAIFGLFKMNILGLLIPIAIMGFCYTRTICVLRRSQTPLRHSAIRLVLVIVAAFFCCWTPYNIASFFKALELLGVYTECESSKAIRLTLQITEAIAYFHGCLNPLLYFCVGERFRRNLLKLINSAPCKLFQVCCAETPQASAQTQRAITNKPQETPCVDEKCEESIALKKIECSNSIN